MSIIDPKIQQVTESLPEAAWISDTAGTILYLNTRGKEAFGNSSSPDESLNWFSLAHDEDATRAREVWNKAIATQTPYRTETRIRNKAGQYRWQIAKASPLRDQDGEIRQWFGTFTDIDDQKKSETSVRLSQERYRALSEVFPRIIWESRSDGYATYFNQWWHDLTGLTMKESEGFGWSAALHPDYREQVVKVWCESVAKGSEYEIETPIRRSSDGVYRWHLARGLPIKDAHGAVTKWIGTALDIHDVKISQERVAASERQLSTLIDNVPGTVYRCRNDQDWSMLFVSEGTMALTGYSPEEFINKKMNFGQLIHPDDADRVWHEVQSGLEKSSQFTMEYRIVTRSGALKWVWEQGVGIFGSSNELIALEGLVIDITDRKLALLAAKESEARFKLLSNSIPQIVWITNPAGRATYTNDGWTTFFGPSGHDLNWEQRVHPNDLKKAQDEFRRASETKTTFKIELRLKNISERYQWFLARATPALDLSGQITEWFGTYTNIEDQKAAEQELREAKETAEHASVAKSQFLTKMSHEMRTPMNGILGFSDLLSDAPLKGEHREYIKRIRSNGDHLLRLIDDILDISKIESGKVQIEHVEFSVAKVISDVMQSMQLVARRKDIEAELVIAPDAPDKVTSDPFRLRQILGNLLSNAIKFTERGRIKVTYKKSGTIPRAVNIEIEDTGIGIKTDQAEGLFQPFAQIDSSMTRRFGGTGLGLALSKRLMEALGGTLRLKWSEVSRGSCFEILLPIESAQQESIDSKRRSDCTPGLEARQSPETSLNGLRVLVVEDSPDNIMLLRIYLEKEGIQLGIAHNGVEAIQLASSEDFDLILMDIQMPVLDGLEATRRLRSNGYSKPIIALTAHAMKEEVEKSFAAGFDAHLSKPISRGDLNSALRSLATRTPA